MTKQKLEPAKPLNPGAPKSRGRPKVTAQQAAAMRANIRAHARRLFQEEGYASISMRRLAREVGCTPMTLYKYFDNKIDILRDLWAQVFNDLFDEIDKAIATKSSPESILNITARTYVAYWLDHVDHYRMVFMTEGVSQPEVSIFVGDEPVMARFGIFQTVVAAVVSKEAGDETAGEALRLKVDLLMCTLNGIAHSLITISAYPWSKPDKIVDAAVTGILNS